MRRTNLDEKQRNQLVQFLLQNSKDGKPLYGKMKEASIMFNSSQRTVTRLWATAKKQQAEGQVIYLKTARLHSIKTKKKPIDLELIASMELFKRSSIRKLAAGVNCSKNTVWRWIKSGVIKAHTNAIKPDLTAPNKLLRLRFSLEALEVDRILKAIKFRSMYNTVHIDEKWFYITKTSHRFYLTEMEAEPHRTCKSKKFIPKVMFMCAVCRPIFTDDGTCIFDGKIGIFPFTEQVPAQRKSKNRPAGTLETKAIDSVTKQVIKDCLITQIIPAIMSKWPSSASKHILIQQDNARPHIKDEDPDFRIAASQNGFDIRLVQQPPNSPDMNVNDLGWFRAIQSIQHETACYNVDQLVTAVVTSFAQLEAYKLNNVFLSLQGCMVEVMRLKGHNAYKIPHMGKEALIRQNALPIDLEVPEALIRECIAYMLQEGTVEGIGGLMQYLGIHIS